MSKTRATTKKHTDDVEISSTSSCKVRAYLKSQQHSLLSHYLYWIQKFRNEVVGFCEQRRKTRGVWFHQHPLLVSGWKALDMDTDETLELLPEEISGSDVNAASKWLTKRLDKARLDVSSSFGWNVQAPKKELRSAVYNTWVNLSKNERGEIPDAWLLTLPRTILDQCLQDMSKTYSKAIKDRAAKKNGKMFGKTNKIAGFPQFQKHSYPYSIRFQIQTQKNKTYVESWNNVYADKRKEIYIPSLGVVKFRDSQDLPAIPPEMITLSRNSSGQFHISFVNKDPTSKTNAKLRNVNDHALPMEQVYDHVLRQYVMVPVTLGGDVGLKTLVTYSQKLAKQQAEAEKKEVERIKFFQRQEKRLRWANKSLARKKRGSKRWLKQKIKQGRIHTQVTNQRHDYLKKEAHDVVEHTAIVCLEDIFVGFMLKNKHLSKAAADASLGAFKQYIQWEAIKFGHLVIECGRFDATSKTCHACQYYHKDLKLKDRSWTCPGCNIVLDRDENAAINIRQMALLRVINELETGTIVLCSPKTSKAQKGSSASGNGASKMLSPYPLHKDLTSFIERGGLTSLLALDCAGESQAVGANQQPSSGEAFILPKQPYELCKEQKSCG